MNKTILIIGGAILLLVVGFFAFNSYIYNEEQKAPPVEPYEATLSGEQVCLPHKDTTGPQTLECAIGIKTDSGEYYALDFNAISPTSPTIPGGQHFTASGTVTPAVRLNSDHWQKYQMEGIFSVTELHLEDTSVVSKGKCYVGGCSAQLCSDEPDMVSSCIYNEAYACYKTATCERQAGGQCGWTDSAQLQACLNAVRN